NLVSNALRYSNVNGRVIVSLLPGVERSQSAEFSVCDEGIGIPEDELPHIFEPFFRSNEATSWNQEGSGLGLTIVKQIAERHHCRLLVESESGKGTCVRMIFP